MSDKQRKVFEETPEYYKSMRMEVPTEKAVPEGELNWGFDY